MLHDGRMFNYRYPSRNLRSIAHVNVLSSKKSVSLLLLLLLLLLRNRRLSLVSARFTAQYNRLTGTQGAARCLPLMQRVVLYPTITGFFCARSSVSTLSAGRASARCFPRPRLFGTRCYRP